MSEKAAGRSVCIGLTVEARRLAVAVARGDDLIYYSTKSLVRANTARQAVASAWLHGLASDHRPDAFILSRSDESNARRTGIANSVLQTVYRIGTEKGVGVHQLSIRAARDYLCSGRADRARTKAELAKKYPELRRYLRVKYGYYDLIFNAIAIVLFYESVSPYN